MESLVVRSLPQTDAASLSLSLSLSLSFHIPTHRHLLGVHRRLQVLQELGEVAAAGAREVLAALKKGEREG